MDMKRADQHMKQIIAETFPEGGISFPELYGVLQRDLDGNGNIIVELDQLAKEMCGADEERPLMPAVTKFLIEYYTDEIDAGNYEAACALGALCYSGRFGKRDYRAAFEYYSAAAKHGNETARENLGYCFYYGRGTETDYEKAFRCFAQGAFQGKLRSLYKIGDMYRNGYFLEKDPGEAFRIYNRFLSLKGDEDFREAGAEIFMRMGDAFYHGIGASPDMELALMFYQRAEQLFYRRVAEGDHMVQECYRAVIGNQEEIRRRMQEKLPDYGWVD